ncbi:hypothetical protein GGR50DRAFT_697125 [Xylaria sp. CBS 124048]|nr:hypothetical protein GGR50DRAFT_697125 [Xylaria sp. CBS 124048]
MAMPVWIRHLVVPIAAPLFLRVVAYLALVKRVGRVRQSAYSAGTTGELPSLVRKLEKFIYKTIILQSAKTKQSEYDASLSKYNDIPVYHSIAGSTSKGSIHPLGICLPYLPGMLVIPKITNMLRCRMIRLYHGIKVTGIDMKPKPKAERLKLWLWLCCIYVHYVGLYVMENIFCVYEGQDIPRGSKLPGS